MKRPHFPLAEVQALAAADAFVLSPGPACWGSLEDYLHGELENYRPFARAVIDSLDLGDFFRTERWPRGPAGTLADEYGVELAPEFLQTHGVAIATWYVKVLVREDRRNGRMLFFMSLHPLAFKMQRNAGLLQPAG